MNGGGRRRRLLRAREIHGDEALRVIAIETVHCDARKSGRLYRLFAGIEVAAIVVCARGDNRVIGLDAGDVSLPELERDVAGLRDLLERARV